MTGDHFQCTQSLVAKGNVFFLVACVIDAFKHFHLARKWWGETWEEVRNSATRGSIPRNVCWVIMDVPVDPKNRQLSSSEEIQLPSPRDSLMPILLSALKQTKSYPETWQDFPPSYTGGEDYEDMRGAWVFPDCTKCGHIAASVVKVLEQASIEGDFLGICIRDHSLKLCRMASSLFWNEILFNVLLPVWACMLGPRLQSSNVRSHKAGRSKGRYSETEPCVLGYI